MTIYQTSMRATVPLYSSHRRISSTENFQHGGPTLLQYHYIDSKAHKGFSLESGSNNRERERDTLRLKARSLAHLSRNHDDIFRIHLGHKSLPQIDALDGISAAQKETERDT